MRNGRNWAHSTADIPKEPHWVILKNRCVSIPAQGHGRGPYDESFVEYIYFTNEEDWKKEIQRLSESTYDKNFVAMKVHPAQVTTEVKVDVKVD